MLFSKEYGSKPKPIPLPNPPGGDADPDPTQPGSGLPTVFRLRGQAMFGFTRPMSTPKFK